jgi:hypothetical protein
MGAMTQALVPPSTEAIKEIGLAVVLTGIMDEFGVEQWWNGAMAVEEDTKLASESGLGMKSQSTEVDVGAHQGQDLTVPKHPSLPFLSYAEGNNLLIRMVQQKQNN